MLEGEDLDPRLGDVEYAMVLVRTRHLALQTAGAFVRVDVQRFLHDASSLSHCRNMRTGAYSRPRKMLVSKLSMWQRSIP
jgi:hypothetical protein